MIEIECTECKKVFSYEHEVNDSQVFLCRDCRDKIFSKCSIEYDPNISLEFAEFGGDIRFLDSSCVTLEDAEGNVIDTTCKCGKPGIPIIGKEAFTMMCWDCMYAPSKKENKE